MDNFYIAQVSVGAGGSWAKGPTPEATAAKLKQIIKEDWGSIYDFKGQSTEVPIYKIPMGIEWDLTESGLATESGYHDPVTTIEIAF